jgi:hypothetical protein
MLAQAVVVHGPWFAVPFLLLVASPGYRSFVGAVVVSTVAIFVLMLLGFVRQDLGFGPLTTLGPSVSLLGSVAGATWWIIRAAQREADPPAARALVSSLTCYSGALSGLAFLAWPLWTTL